MPYKDIEKARLYNRIRNKKRRLAGYFDRYKSYMQIYLRSYRNYQKQNLYIKKWKDNNPEKAVVYPKVQKALREGILKRTQCFCGNAKVEAHHEDYSKPLEVIWLCKKHHVEADKIRRNI